MRQCRESPAQAFGLLMILATLSFSAQAVGAPLGAGAQGAAKPAQHGTQVTSPAISAMAVAAPGAKPQGSNVGPSDAAAPQVTQPAGSRDQSAERAILRTEMVLNYATLLVTVVAVLFGVVTAILGFVSYRRFRRQATEIKGFRDEIAAFQLALTQQQRTLSANQRFLDSVWMQYTDSLLGIVSELGKMLNIEDDSGVRGRIFEAEAALNLFHQREEEVRAALRRLEEIGTGVSVPSLTRLMKDESVSPDVRLLTKDVLLAIRERLRRDKSRGSEPSREPGPAAASPEAAPLTPGGNQRKP